MDAQIRQFEQLIKNAGRILITSHISPDPDAVASVLLLGTTLQKNFTDKNVEMVLEEKPARDLSFLADFNAVKFEPLYTVTQKFKPDLFIMLDAMNFERVSRSDDKKLRTLVGNSGAKSVVIDHHTEVGLENNDLYINNQLPATSQEIYGLLFDKLKLAKPDGYAETVLLGIISDTARFKYDNPRHRETFKIVSELLDAGASIEALENKIERYNEAQLKAFSALANNIKDSGKGYTYTYLDESAVAQSSSKEDKIASIKAAAEMFTNQFARNFEDNNWGFVVGPDIASGPGIYFVSLRSMTGGIDVAELAQKLGGGGHKQAAGAKFKAKDIKDALIKVEQTIKVSEN